MIWATSGPPESDSLMWKVDRIASVAIQITQPASMGTIAHQRLCTAERVTTPIKTMPTTASRRPSISIAENPSPSSTGGPTTAGWGNPCRAANSPEIRLSSAVVSITLC